MKNIIVLIAFFNNTLDSWNEDEEKYQKKAGENWTKTIKS